MARLALMCDIPVPRDWVCEHGPVLAQRVRALRPGRTRCPAAASFEESLGRRCRCGTDLERRLVPLVVNADQEREEVRQLVIAELAVDRHVLVPLLREAAGDDRARGLAVAAPLPSAGVVEPPHVVALLVVAGEVGEA